VQLPGEHLADNWTFIQYVCTSDLYNRQVYCTWFDILKQMYENIPNYGNVLNCMLWDKKKTDTSRLWNTDKKQPDASLSQSADNIGTDAETTNLQICIRLSRENTFNMSRDLLLCIQKVCYTLRIFMFIHMSIINRRFKLINCACAKLYFYKVVYVQQFACCSILYFVSKSP
jgi:hypothetical protein